MSRVRTNSSAAPAQRMRRLDRARQRSRAAPRSARAGRDGRARTPARRRRRRASASSAAWLSSEKLAGSAMSGGATPSSTLRRTACGNWRWYSSATRVPYDDADEVDALGAERAPHRVEVLHRDRGREEAAGRSRRGRTAASAAAPCTAARGGSWRSGSACSASVSCSASWHCERRRAAGAALVDEDDVAPVVEPAEERHRRRGDARSRSGPGRRRGGTPGRRTCGAPSPARRRSGSGSARRCGRAGSSGRCSVPQRTPLRMPATWQSAERRRRRRRRSGRRGRRRCRPAGGRTGRVDAVDRRASTAAVRTAARASQRPRPIGTGAPRGPTFAGELIRRACASAHRRSRAARARSAPPTSVPLTKTIGKVGQPVHIFSALRRRQSLK